MATSLSASLRSSSATDRSRKVTDIEHSRAALVAAAMERYPMEYPHSRPLTPSAVPARAERQSRQTSAAPVPDM